MTATRWTRCAPSFIGRFGIDIACLLGCEPPTPRPAEEADGIYARGTMPLALAICEDTCREGRPPARIVTLLRTTPHR